MFTRLQDIVWDVAFAAVLYGVSRGRRFLLWLERDR